MDSTTLLFVDDDPDIRAIVGIVLGLEANWSVHLADSGAQALGMVQGEGLKPDLIIMDVMMPHMNGPETLSRLRRVPACARTPVIFLTAAARTGELDMLRAMGASAVLTKPFDPMSLASILRTHL